MCLLTFKVNGTSEYGIAYVDKLGRVSKTITHHSLKHTIEPSTNVSDNGAISLDIDFSHTHPDWAKKMILYKRRSNGISNFIQFPLSINNTIANGDLNRDIDESEDPPYQLELVIIILLGM
jgi:hypothetical protein